jgi:hypothetical protein
MIRIARTREQTVALINTSSWDLIVSRKNTLITYFLVGVVSTPSFAVEEVLIDPATVADASTHFMVKIMESGYYRLTGDLLVPDANTTAIEINADDVVVDLGGFAIRGPARCSAKPVSCKPVGTGNGVHVVWRNNIVVKNGTILGMGNVGVYLETRTGEVAKLQLENNAGGGAVLFGGMLAESVVQRNGSDGVLGLDTRIQDSVIRNNQGYGFRVYGNSSAPSTKFIGNNKGKAQISRSLP